MVLYTDRWFGASSVGIGAYRVPTDGRGRVWINFDGGRPPAVLAARDLLDGSADLASVRGKVVIVGASALGVGDIWPTSASTAAPGVQIYAQAVENLLAGAVPTRPGYALAIELGLVLAAGLYLLWNLRRRTVQGKLLVFLTLAAGILAASMAAYAVRWVLFDPTFPIAASLAILLYLGYRDFRAEERLLALQETRLRRADAFMRRIVDNSFDAIFAVDGDGAILTANPAATALLGGGDLAGQPLAGFLEHEPTGGDAGSGGLRVGDLAELGAIDAVVCAEDGERRAVELTVKPMRDDPVGVAIVVMRDVTDRKQAEAVARRALGRLADAIESIPEGFALIDRNGVLALCNHRFATMIGVADPADLAGRPLREILHDWALGAGGPLLHDGGIDAWLETCAARFGQPMAPREQEPRNGHWLRIAGQPTADGGTVALFTDIDDLKSREALLTQEKVRAEQANMAKSQFLANVSHELRTPLNAIIGFTEIMAGRMFGPIGNDRYEEYVGDIQGSSQYLLQLIDDLMDLSKFDLGATQIEARPVDLARAAMDACGLLGLQAEQAGVVLEPHLPDGLPALFADRGMIRQIFLNLLTNAINYTPRGGRVTVSVACEPDGGLALVVADTGCGVAAGSIARMTEPFWRSDDPMTREHPGVGLGLTLVASFVERHEATLEIDSKEGQGTSVTVRFPPSRVVDAASDTAMDGA